ncbi:hypothetical protein [Haloechinothrix halophila]|uniref:hypothetical protein n=1 Tax=Haloechinothrix halophila TaxID=1069073 RepID=UPI0004172DAA|nr:hypothetical protein [Haloechinothrix halophila]
MIEHGEDRWEGGWDVHGIRADDGRTVAITIGVINSGDDVWVATGVGNQSPVVLSTDRASAIPVRLELAVTGFGWIDQLARDRVVEPV